MTSTVPHLIVVDVETSGLDPQHDVLEVAAIDLATRQELYFVPKPINVGWLQDAHPGALKVNRYFERGVYAHKLDYESTCKRWKALGEMLEGNILVGANPEFDARFVDAAMKFHDVECRRRYQLRDLATYAAGVLGTDPAEPTSSADIFKALGVTNREPHSALGDARATAEAFRTLKNRRAREQER